MDTYTEREPILISGDFESYCYIAEDECGTLLSVKMSYNSDKHTGYFSVFPVVSIQDNESNLFHAVMESIPVVDYRKLGENLSLLECISKFDNMIHLVKVLKKDGLNSFYDVVIDTIRISVIKNATDGGIIAITVKCEDMADRYWHIISTNGERNVFKDHDHIITYILDMYTGDKNVFLTSLKRS